MVTKAAKFLWLSLILTGINAKAQNFSMWTVVDLSHFSQSFDNTFMDELSPGSSWPALAASIDNQAFNWELPIIINAVRFDKRSFVSQRVVNSILQSETIAKKYSRVKSHYDKSLVKYKELIPVASQAVEAGKAGTPELARKLPTAASQQIQIVEEALKYYHAGQELVELGESRRELMRNGAREMASKHSFSAENASSMKSLLTRIDVCQKQLDKLRKDLSNHKIETEFARSESAKLIQVLGQSLVEFSNLTDPVISVLDGYLVAPAASKMLIAVSKDMVVEYIEQSLKDDKPFQEAITKAFEKGYEAARNEALDQFFDKYKEGKLKNIMLIPKMTKQLHESLGKWQEINDAKAQKEMINSYNKVIDFSQQAIELNEKCVDKATKEMTYVIDSAVTQFLNMP
nr:hypothetical protein [uncultured Dyadobacter sp.]